MKTLLIVESPAKCNKILSFLNDSYACEATYGHLREINSLKQINNTYEIEFNNVSSKQKQISKLRQKINKSSNVLLATDDDREGEAIAWHIVDMFNLPITTPRIKFNSITRESILNAINNPTTLDMHLVQSQQTRQILDLSVGYKISPILWNTISRSNNLSAGRCQTPALSILYEHYKHQLESEENLQYNVYGYFTNKVIKFSLNKTLSTPEEVVSFLQLIKNHKGYVLTHNTKPKLERKPPLPFITSSLQQSCSNLFNMSPKECMSICQALYEQGHITYMRTDSYYIVEDFREKCYNFISQEHGNEYVNRNIQHKKKQGSQEAHEAIRPTQLIQPALQSKQKRVYDLIYNQTLQSMMASCVYDKHIFSAKVNDVYAFQYTEEDIVFPGWLIRHKVNENKETYIHYLSNVSHIETNKITCDPGFSDVKHHYTEAKLINELEKRQIGRPSTYASIVEKLKERKYVMKQNVEGVKKQLQQYELRDNKIFKKKIEKVVGKEKNKLVIQPLGLRVVELLSQHFSDIFNYTFTEEMEKQLDNIAENEASKVEVCQTYTDMIATTLKTYKSNESSEKQRFVMDDNNEFIFSKNGPVIKETIDGKTVFKKVVENVDYDKLKRGEYSLNELIDTSSNEKLLGSHKNIDVILKKGKYGMYVVYDGKNVSLGHIDKDFDSISLVDVIDKLDGEGTNIVRIITNEISIRKGKFGDYIFYKTKLMKRPKFINIKKIDDDYTKCDKQIIIDYVDSQ